MWTSLKFAPIRTVRNLQNSVVQAWNFIFEHVERARPFSFLFKGHLHWKIFKSIGNFWRGTQSKTRGKGNRCHYLRGLQVISRPASEHSQIFKSHSSHQILIFRKIASTFLSTFTSDATSNTRWIWTCLSCQEFHLWEGKAILILHRAVLGHFHLKILTTTYLYMYSKHLAGHLGQEF